LFNYHALLVWQFDVERKIKDKTSFYGTTSLTFCLACYIFVNKVLLFWQVLLPLQSAYWNFAETLKLEISFPQVMQVSPL
jgi:hypothetical protein